jgi:Sulfotransferase domain
MKVIGAGFGRTGTASLKAALEVLGFGPCYHMFEVFMNPEHIPFWEQASRGEKVDFAALFEGWPSVVDWPACSFYRELMELYPDAKVVLSVRDPERWYQSCLATIYPASTQAPPVSDPDKSDSAEPEFVGPEFINRLIWQGTFHGRFEERDYAVELFNRHTAEVRQHVPPDRLLVFDVKEGWEPLCNFLGVPVPPDQPFPHLNDRASYVEGILSINSEL